MVRPRNKRQNYPLLGLLTIESNFKPNLMSVLGEGGQAKVFKATFHGKDVAMKYIPLDKFKDTYTFDWASYGCHEYYEQEKFFIVCMFLFYSSKRISCRRNLFMLSVNCGIELSYICRRY